MRRLAFWVGQDVNVAESARSCQTCQRTKAEHCGPRGLIHILPLPLRRGGMIGVDWIVGLPTTAAGFDMIQNHFDLLSSNVHAVPTRSKATAADAAAIILGMCLRSGDGFPDVLVVDHDSKFTSEVFRALVKGWGSCLALPRRMRCSPMVNVDRLKPSFERAGSPPAPGPVSDAGQEGEREVELLLNRRTVRGVTRYHALSRYRGHASADDEWLRPEELAHCPEKVVKYDAAAPRRGITRRPGPAAGPVAPRCRPGFDAAGGTGGVSASGTTEVLAGAALIGSWPALPSSGRLCSTFGRPRAWSAAPWPAAPGAGRWMLLRRVH